jgi:OHCU decarboxylase
MAGASLTLAELNDADQELFTETVGLVFEASPHFAARAWFLRPFVSFDHLFAALQAIVKRSSPEEQLDLIRAHPDLAGKAAIAGNLTDDSRREQSSVGLDNLTPQQFATFTRLNAAYRARFGFPFIICVREHTRDSILASFETRLGNNAEQERARALEEIGKIARLRLFNVVEVTNQEDEG